MSRRERSLAACHGFLVVATDGLCGAVETPLFPPNEVEPDFVIIRVGGRVRPRFPVVSTALVEDVDLERELVFLRARRDEIARLPEQLPLAV